MQKPTSVVSETIPNATVSSLTCLVIMRQQDVKKLVQGYGFKLIRQKKHFIWKHPSGLVLTTAQSPSDRRALSNIDKRIRRMLAL